MPHNQKVPSSKSAYTMFLLNSNDVFKDFKFHPYTLDY